MKKLIEYEQHIYSIKFISYELQVYELEKNTLPKLLGSFYKIPCSINRWFCEDTLKTWLIIISIYSSM